MAVAGELRAALSAESGLRRLVDGVPAEMRRGALAWLPLVALARGGLALAAARATASFGGPVSLVAAVAVLEAARPAAGATAVGPRSAAAVRLLCAAPKVLALLLTPPPARPLALVLAPVLGAWAAVVQCYGGAAGERAVPSAGFREFGWASVVAIGLTLGLLDAVGLVLVVAAALVVVALRVLAHRLSGRMTPAWLAATRDGVEVLALALLAAAARLLA